ncbi:Hypothetical_protein [Hexamita inflata]|uniref:Hypothetical_protein n=1 Tax=Hexamita inflata TaxID=28002 RepID=A0AA86RBS9_9EUKA|nr:Hypothetical protein HINF_LOCUS62781 [Hexamita inflata]
MNRTMFLSQKAAKLNEVDLESSDEMRLQITISSEEFTYDEFNDQITKLKLIFNENQFVSQRDDVYLAIKMIRIAHIKYKTYMKNELYFSMDQLLKIAMDNYMCDFEVIQMTLYAIINHADQYYCGDIYYLLGQQYRFIFDNYETLQADVLSLIANLVSLSEYKTQINLLHDFGLNDILDQFNNFQSKPLIKSFIHAFQIIAISHLLPVETVIITCQKLTEITQSENLMILFMNVMAVPCYQEGLLDMYNTISMQVYEKIINQMNNNNANVNLISTHLELIQVSDDLQPFNIQSYLDVLIERVKNIKVIHWVIVLLNKFQIERHDFVQKYLFSTSASIKSLCFQYFMNYPEFITENVVRQMCNMKVEHQFQQDMDNFLGIWAESTEGNLEILDEIRNVNDIEIIRKVQLL